jgi:hypothetical protein
MPVLSSKVWQLIISIKVLFLSTDESYEEPKVKITSLLGTIGYTYKVREKQDGDSSSSFQQHLDQEQSKKDDDSNPDQEDPSNPEKLDQAIEAFQTDSQAQANGLSATRVGTGPGLKIVLKDEAGSVVRQFTGEEFLKLRQAASNDGKARGKLLDQKL